MSGSMGGAPSIAPALSVPLVSPPPAALSAIALPERLTISEASTTLARLLPLLQAAEVLELDASALQQMDSSAVAVLLACQREAALLGRPLQVSGAPPKLKQLAQLYGVESLLGL